MWGGEHYGPDPDHRMSPAEALEAVQRSRREKGLPDYAVFSAELLQWVSRGSLSAGGAVEWIKVWARELKK